MKALRYGAGSAITVGALLLLRAGSLAPTRTAATGESVLRLSWSARPERIEQCKRRSDDELAALPQHMRLRWNCEGVFARYLLTVSVDGTPMAQDTVRGSGLRNDRPMHLFREFALVPGTRHIAVSMKRIDTETPPDSTDAGTDVVAAGAAAADRETREGQERRARRAEALPEIVALDTTLTVSKGRVALVSYSSTERRLLLNSER